MTVSGFTGTSDYERVVNDWYVEDRRCVDEFLQREPLLGPVWDPCCGAGNIPSAVAAVGYDAHGTDIENRGYGPVVNFFDTRMLVPTIISNPPFRFMEPFIDHAMASTSHKVVVLARLAFLEGQGRQSWFRRLGLARVYVSSRRLSMPPGGTNIPAKNGTVAYGWFVFEHGHTGLWTGDWV